MAVELAMVGTTAVGLMMVGITMVYIGRLAGVSPRSSHSIPLCVLRLDSYAENDVALVRPCRQKHPHRTPHAKAPSSTGAGGVALGFILRECTNLVLALDRCYDAKIYIYIYLGTFLAVARSQSFE